MSKLPRYFVQDVITPGIMDAVAMTVLTCILMIFALEDAPAYWQALTVVVPLQLIAAGLLSWTICGLLELSEVRVPLVVGWLWLILAAAVLPTLADSVLGDALSGIGIRRHIVAMVTLNFMFLPIAYRPLATALAQSLADRRHQYPDLYPDGL